MMTHDEMIAVITHHKNGGKVEFRRRSMAEDDWMDVGDPAWDFSCSDYRAKPKPLVLWAVYVENVLVASNQDGDLMLRVFSEHNAPFKNVTLKKFVEAAE